MISGDVRFSMSGLAVSPKKGGGLLSGLGLRYLWYYTNENLLSELGYLIFLWHEMDRRNMRYYFMKKEKRVLRYIMCRMVYGDMDAFDMDFIISNDLRKVLHRSLQTLMTYSKQLFDAVTYLRRTTERRLRYKFLPPGKVTKNKRSLDLISCEGASILSMDLPRMLRAVICIGSCRLSETKPIAEWILKEVAQPKVIGDPCGSVKSWIIFKYLHRTGVSYSNETVVTLCRCSNE